MEIRARYVQMGIFTLAVIVMGFAFIYWLNNAGALREHTIYRVRFEGPVSGLASGSAVLFNGIRVGGVTRLQLNPDDPRQVQATIAVDRGTPVRADTTAGIDFQGLTGSPVIALVGGTSRTRLAAAKGETPLLVADPTASQSMSQAAREVLRRMDGVLAENAQPLRDMIGNINTFSGALARNSDRLDGIVAGLERMTGGATSKARIATYDLTVPRVTESAAKVPTAQLVIPDPTALAALDNDRIQRRKLGHGRRPMERRPDEAGAVEAHSHVRGRRFVRGRQPPVGRPHGRLSALRRRTQLPDRNRCAPQGGGRDGRQGVRQHRPDHRHAHLSCRRGLGPGRAGCRGCPRPGLRQGRQRARRLDVADDRRSHAGSRARQGRNTQKAHARLSGRCRLRRINLRSRRPD
jgi:MlaD protein